MRAGGRNCRQLAKWTVKMLKYSVKCHKSWPGLRLPVLLSPPEHWRLYKQSKKLCNMCKRLDTHAAYMCKNFYIHFCQWAKTLRLLPCLLFIKSSKYTKHENCVNELQRQQRVFLTIGISLDCQRFKVY